METALIVSVIGFAGVIFSAIIAGIFLLSTGRLSLARPSNGVDRRAVDIEGSRAGDMTTGYWAKHFEQAVALIAQMRVDQAMNASKLDALAAKIDTLSSKAEKGFTDVGRGLGDILHEMQEQRRNGTH